MKILPFRIFLGLGLLNLAIAVSAQSNDRYIVRVSGGQPAIEAICVVLGCNVNWGLNDPQSEVFLVTDPDPNFLTTILGEAGIIDAEADQLAAIAGSSYAVPSALYDSQPINYYGAMVPQGYVNQIPNQIIRLSDTQSGFGVKGAGIVAIIDTGIDPNHPALKGVLVSGYDFTRNQNGEGNEILDVNFTTPPAQSSDAEWTSSDEAAKVTQSTAAVVDGDPRYADFGHGTMVAGIVHVVAPGAQLMPLKAFSANGTGYNSDIIRAIYFAVQNNANILNMSFNLAGDSQEVKSALNWATLNGLISIASAGNQGKEVVTYPAAYSNVIGVGSTNDSDVRSTFSNYGTPPVWLAAPGEGIVTTYPFATYAAGWGTSFSAPYVTGEAALMLDYGSSIVTDILISQDQSDCANAVAHAKAIGQDLGNGRLDTYDALEAWREIMGKL